MLGNPRHRHPLFVLAFAFLLVRIAHSEPGHVFKPLTPDEQQAIRAAIPDHPRARPAKPRHVLIFYRTEGFVHASIPHANEALEELGERTGAYTAQTGEDLPSLDPAQLAHYDAIIFNNTTHLSLTDLAHRTALLAFVKSGKGIVGIHAASDSFYTWPEGQELLGGFFHSHPWGSGDTVAVKLDDPQSPINATFGGHGFWVKDEIYQIIGPYSRTRQHVLLSLDMSRPENARKPDELVRTDNDFPIAWIKQEGRGRVFYTSLGHNPEDYRTRGLLQHFLDGIQYALGDLPADATPTAKLKSPPQPALAPPTRHAINE